jgi:hypothetical protein
MIGYPGGTLVTQFVDHNHNWVTWVSYRRPDLPNHGAPCRALDNFEKLSMSRGALTWFGTAWSYGVVAIDYWTIFSTKTKLNQNWKLYFNFRAFLVLLESPWQLKFNRAYFTIFRAQVWKISFLSGFCCWKFKQIAKNGFGWKNQLRPQCVHIAQFTNSQFWKCEK